MNSSHDDSNTSNGLRLTIISPLFLSFVRIPCVYLRFLGSISAMYMACSGAQEFWNGRMLAHWMSKWRWCYVPKNVGTELKKRTYMYRDKHISALMYSYNGIDHFSKTRSQVLS